MQLGNILGNEESFTLFRCSVRSRLPCGRLVSSAHAVCDGGEGGPVLVMYVSRYGYGS